MPVARAHRLAARLAVVAGLGLAPWAAEGADVSASSDVAAELGTNAVTAADEDVLTDAMLGPVTPIALGSLPEAADVVAYAALSGGEFLLAFDTTVELSGPLTARRGDIVRYDGVSTYSIELDASSAGVPAGVVADAVSETTGGLLLSFDITADLGGSLVVADEDLVHWNGSSFALVLDGSAAGIHEALDVDAVHDSGSQVYAVSFDGSGSVGGVDFADEDVLSYDAVGTSWTLAYDASAQDADWEAADLDAVALPEPGLPAALAAGGAALGRPIGCLAPGCRADLLVLDAELPCLWGKTDDVLLDAVVFAGNRNPVRDVMVGGEWLVEEGRHRDRDAVLAGFQTAITELRD